MMLRLVAALMLPLSTILIFQINVVDGLVVVNHHHHHRPTTSNDRRRGGASCCQGRVHHIGNHILRTARSASLPAPRRVTTAAETTKGTRFSFWSSPPPMPASLSLFGVFFRESISRRRESSTAHLLTSISTTISTPSNDDAEREESSKTTTELKAASTSSSLPAEEPTSSSIIPSWREIFEIPIHVNTKEDFYSIPRLKRWAIVSRVSVLHLTILSCFGPFIFRGALRSAAITSGGGVNTLLPPPLSPLRAILFLIDGLSFHATHNLLNDWQDLDDDDSKEDSFRLAYGCHALKQGYLSKNAFLRIMAMVALPGALLTMYFSNTVLAPAAIYGVLALFFYTIVFKPIALGELLIWVVWGPLMAGFGFLASGTPSPWANSITSATSGIFDRTALSFFFANPAITLFGMSALATIMGKHTDKITRSKKRTLPKLIGFPAALFACGATIIFPHLLLLFTLLKERGILGFLRRGVGGSAAVGVAASAPPTIPIGATLAFLTLLREVPATIRILLLGSPASRSKDPENDVKPTLPEGTVLPGTILEADIDRAWPLWFVAFCGWHGITFTYLMVIGSGIEWIVRALIMRV